MRDRVDEVQYRFGFGGSRPSDASRYNFSPVGAWLSLVEHSVRDRGVGGSNPLAPTNFDATGSALRADSTPSRRLSSLHYARASALAPFRSRSCRSKMRCGHRSRPVRRSIPNMNGRVPARFCRRDFIQCRNHASSETPSRRSARTSRFSSAVVTLHIAKIDKTS